ncbi:hypothetical protein [Bacillus sp. FJAT-47783]|uniref:hypothetical protein n=1 Tax=Bacillus sp. FJAT-47783 TaxID=2922712 RepID=UPI001FAC4FC4|nr:hypothetical protein [Bacillus sp. FJAT-47783]
MKKMVILSTILLLSSVTVAFGYYNNEGSTLNGEQNKLPSSHKVIQNNEIGDQIAEAPLQQDKVTEIKAPSEVNNQTKEQKAEQIEDVHKEENTSVSSSQELSYILNHLKANQTKEEVINILGSDYKVKQDETGHSLVPNYWLYEIGTEPGYEFKGQYDDELDIEGLINGKVKLIVTVFFDKKENGQEVVHLANVYVKDGDSVKEMKIMDE